MKIALNFIIAVILVSFVNVNANDELICKHILEKKNHYKIASAISDHAFEKHELDFKTPANRKKNKSIPWTLSNENELAQFIEDILNEASIASRDDKTLLKVIKSKPLANGRYAWLEVNTGTFVVYNPKKPECGSAYRDDNMDKHFENQI